MTGVQTCALPISRDGRPDNTLVIFTSEQGNSLPFGGKWSCYETGLKTSFIARWPEKIKPNTRNTAMTQYVDVVPTLVEAAGGDPDVCRPGRPDAAGNTGFDGRSFLKVLFGAAQTHRDYVYGVHTTLGVIGCSTPYPIRSIRSSRYKYIWNVNWKNSFEKAAAGNSSKILRSWRDHHPDDPTVAQRVRFYQNRPEEELYNLQADPWELKNLAEEKTLASVKADLRAALLVWMKQQGDAGLETENQALSRLKSANRQSTDPGED